MVMRRTVLRRVFLLHIVDMASGLEVEGLL